MSSQTFTCEWYDIPCHLTSLQAEIKQFALWTYEEFTNAMISTFELIGVPNFMADLPNIVLPSGVSYFANIFMFEQGLSIIVSAYGARWLYHRIPFFGK